MLGPFWTWIRQKCQFPARTTWPPCKVTTCPLLSLNLLPRGLAHSQGPDEPVQAPLVLGENNLREQFLFEAALENRDDLHASDEEIQQLGQVEVEDGREIPGSQENDLELPDHERDQAPSVDRPGVVQVLVGGRKRIRDSTTSHLERSPKVKRSRERTAKLLL